MCFKHLYFFQFGDDFPHNYSQVVTLGDGDVFMGGSPTLLANRGLYFKSTDWIEVLTTTINTGQFYLAPFFELQITFFIDEDVGNVD